MSSVHVAMITFDWYPFDPRVRRLAEAAVDGGNEMDVICLCQADEPRYEKCNGVHIYRLPMNRGFGHSLFITILSWCWFLLLAGVTVTWLHLKRSYDVIHVHNMPDFLVFSALLPKLLGASIILDIQDVSPEMMAVKANGHSRSLLVHLAIWQEHISTMFAHHVITVGWPFEELLLKRGVPSDKLTSILNSADPKLFPPSRQIYPRPTSSNEEEQFIIMYHGTLATRNGVDTAIRALKLVLRDIPNARLDIGGRGEQLPELKRLATELGIDNKVVFNEPCPSDKIVDFVEHGDVGIIPYRRDGFMDLVLPTKAYEFAWMHRPIIASDTPAIRSMFRPGSVVLCNRPQSEDFAAAIVDLYRHPERREQMVMNAAEDYMAYQWEMMAERYQYLLTSLGQKRLRRQYITR